MNVNKYFSFAIVVFIMAVQLVLTSCGKDDILDDAEGLQPELKVWTEPYHIEGSSIDDVKNYMDFSFNEAIWSCIGDYNIQFYSAHLHNWQR